jgi:FkbM family methyltransferase
MKIGKRNLRQTLKAIFGKQHYVALLNMFRVYPEFFNALFRYLSGRGKYPCAIRLKTPLGIISPVIFSYYDMLTVNEIFCRRDYGSDEKASVVVDFGSNIGISALYFLTRNIYCRCYLFEPVPENIKKLNDNLKNYADRYVLNEAAVSDEGGIKKFGTEEFGRCGGLSRETGSYINVKCVNVNDVLAEILGKEKNIDILKIDTEGNELGIINAIDRNILPRIRVIYFEIDHTIELNDDYKILPEYYEQSRYGNTIRLILKINK